jgi:hypothetical protein
MQFGWSCKMLSFVLSSQCVLYLCFHCSKELGLLRCPCARQVASATAVRIHRMPSGGEAYVEFQSSADGTRALSRHKAMLGTRYIELVCHLGDACGGVDVCFISMLPFSK